MSLLNLLAAITGQTGPEAVDPNGNPVDPNATAEVDPLVVTASPKASPAPSIEQTESRVPFNYNNRAAAEAVDQAVGQLPTPRGGGANPGLWGLLPEHMQHGTLRNVIGAIGDAFLVQSGNAPTYAPRMERQRLGQAMAGYDPDDPDTVQAAVQRVAASGMPGSVELAQDMQKDYGNQRLREQNAESLTEYRKAQIGSKQATIFNNMAPKIQGLMYGVQTPEDYMRRYTLADSIAKRIDPESDATLAFGLVEPDQWEPGMETGYGMTQNQHVVSEDKAAGRATTERGQDLGYQGRIEAANINADARRYGTDKATTATMIQGLMEKRDRGEELTPAEQEFWDKQTNIPRRRARPKGAAPSQTQQYKVPSSADKAYLKAHPEHRAKWDEIYGPGSAAKILGK